MSVSPLSRTWRVAYAVQFLRPRWKGLYAARKKQNAQSTALPELPDSFFGWILPLWRITEEQVLASAGLDAYVVWRAARGRMRNC